MAFRVNFHNAQEIQTQLAQCGERIGLLDQNSQVTYPSRRPSQQLDESRLQYLQALMNIDCSQLHQLVFTLTQQIGQVETLQDVLAEGYFFSGKKYKAAQFGKDQNKAEQSFRRKYLDSGTAEKTHGEDEFKKIKDARKNWKLVQILDCNLDHSIAARKEKKELGFCSTGQDAESSALKAFREKCEAEDDSAAETKTVIRELDESRIRSGKKWLQAILELHTCSNVLFNQLTYLQKKDIHEEMWINIAAAYSSFVTYLSQFNELIGKVEKERAAYLTANRLTLKVAEEKSAEMIEKDNTRLWYTQLRGMLIKLINSSEASQKSSRSKLKSRKKKDVGLEINEDAGLEKDINQGTYDTEPARTTLYRVARFSDLQQAYANALFDENIRMRPYFQMSVVKPCSFLEESKTKVRNAELEMYSKLISSIPVQKVSSVSASKTMPAAAQKPPLATAESRRVQDEQSARQFMNAMRVFINQHWKKILLCIFLGMCFTAISIATAGIATGIGAAAAFAAWAGVTAATATTTTIAGGATVALLWGSTVGGAIVFGLGYLAKKFMKCVKTIVRVCRGEEPESDLSSNESSISEKALNKPDLAAFCKDNGIDGVGLQDTKTDPDPSYSFPLSPMRPLQKGNQASLQTTSATLSLEAQQSNSQLSL